MVMKNILKVIKNDHGVQTIELLIIVSLLAAIAILSGVRLRGGATNAANTVSNRIKSYATGGAW